MINKTEFSSMLNDMEEADKKREATILLSREVIRLSKQIIYSVHRNELGKAADLLKEIEKKVKKLPKRSVDEGISKVAFQEYVEAISFYEFVKNNKIPGKKKLGVESEDYLAGLADLTGELVRKAVNSVIEEKYDDAFKIRELVDEIYGQLSRFDFRNGDLRKKFDSIKWNLNKIEGVVYDVKVKK